MGTLVGMQFHKNRGNRKWKWDLITYYVYAVKNSPKQSAEQSMNHEITTQTPLTALLTPLLVIVRRCDTFSLVMRDAF